MVHTWKEGERVRLDGVVVRELSDHIRILFPGDEDPNWITKKAMAHATLVESVPELDLAKPIQTKDGKQEMEFVDRTERGGILVRSNNDDLLRVFWPEVLENIPTQKNADSMNLVALCSIWAGATKPFGVYYDNGIPQSSVALSRAKVTYTEGEGWSVEEVK
jgi:hypothetical protein